MTRDRWRPLRHIALEGVARGIRRRFRAVSSISGDALEACLGAPRCTPLLLDVRTAEEFEISHLPGAQRLDPAETDFSALEARRDRDVVVYCAVGYRSARMAERLREAGFARVRDLSGGIFRWANQGRPLVRGALPAHAVHPYDRRWARLLDPRLRAPLARGVESSARGSAPSRP